MSKEKINRIIDGVISEWRVPKTPARILAAGPTLTGLTQCTAELAEKPVVDATLPPDVVSFWSLYKKADLFIEIRSQLWGLRLLSYVESKDETELFRTEDYSQYKKSDLVLGTFFGLPDRLIVRCDAEAVDFGHIDIVIFDGKRDEGYSSVEKNFADFLERYAQAEGEMYWIFSGGDGTSAGKDW